MARSLLLSGLAFGAQAGSLRIIVVVGEKEQSATSFGRNEPRIPDEIMERLSRRHTVTMPEGAPFSALETASFGFARMISVDETLDWLATGRLPRHRLCTSGRQLQG